ncbi:putative RNA binding protein YcfA (HicA-like mRNA interferase family) [Paenibacillus sp. RC254]|uniref:type II toxin-antitoxin system HicA family toxin n=1 Tax=unclassified Paenibacillus TaxID=185978 RepID=UPI0024BBB8A0|nr:MULTISPECIES: type II toxin-antitoxin system HicA family toxin [unclassified Paenibacillus]
MARINKLIQKMKDRPNGIRFEEVEKVLEHYGYIKARHDGTSHCQFRNDKGDLITVKKKNPLKAACVKDVLGRIGE